MAAVTKTINQQQHNHPLPSTNHSIRLYPPVSNAKPTKSSPFQAPAKIPGSVTIILAVTSDDVPVAFSNGTSSSSRAVPSISKLSPGQAAYHFLAGYQNGTFVPAYNKCPSFNLVELSKALYSKLKDFGISSYLVNVCEGEKHITGMDLVKLIRSSLTKEFPPFKPKGGNLQRKYKNFLSSKFKELPEEFTF